MAAADKLIPTAILIANNLRGTKYSTSGTFKLPAKKISVYQNPVQDTYQFFSSVYAKIQKVANSNETWNFEMVVQNQLTPKNVQALYTPNRNIHSLDLSMIVAISEPEWNELNYAVSKAVNIIYPDLLINTRNLFNTNTGLFNNGAGDSSDLIGVNGHKLVHVPQGIEYADKWNKIKVPYDKTLGTVTEFIAPLLNKKPGTDDFWYRYTGIRHWNYPFIGYNAI